MFPLHEIYWTEVISTMETQQKHAYKSYEEQILYANISF